MKKNIEEEYLGKVHTAFFHTVIGCILPFIIGAILLSLVFKFDKILLFLDKGDFCIYSAALFSTSIYLFSENREYIKAKLDNMLINVQYYLLTVSAVIYGAIYLVETLNPALSAISINYWIVRIFSITLFIFSLISVYRSFLIQKKNALSGVDVQSESKNDIDQILKEL